MNKTQYDHDFYDNQKEGSYQSAKQVVPIILNILPNIHSILDVGCGVGTWLSAFREAGVEKINGMDGSYVNPSQLYIDKNDFFAHDLSKPFDLGMKFDLVSSLEVAEHLPEESAQIFIDSLCRHSNTILFSAAIPGQSGTHHINEQYPTYWAKRFLENGYFPCDCLRNLIWETGNIYKHYRQNILFFVNEKSSLYKDKDIYRGPLDIVHPEMLLKATSISSFRALLSLQVKIIKKAPSCFYQAITRRVKRLV